jgi:hypothetical protein
MQATTSKYLWTILLLFLFCTGMAVTPARAAVPPGERTALVALYFSTHGSGWTRHDNWLIWESLNPPQITDPCDDNWYGVTCNADNTHVTRLNLSANNLNGTLPDSLGNLANQQYLNFRNNQLSGTIPDSIGNLANLRILYLDNNQLCGVIPPALMNLTNLNDGGLWLSGNNLDTDVSPELDAFISQKSSGDWKSGQGTVAVCRRSDFPWPMFLPALTTSK